VIDTVGRSNYLPALFRSLRVSAIVKGYIALTDFEGQVITSNQSDGAGHVLPETLLNSVMVGKSHVTLDEKGLLVARPVLYGNFPEGAIEAFMPVASLGELFLHNASDSEVALLDLSNRILFQSSEYELSDDWIYKDVDLPSLGGVRLRVALPKSKILESAYSIGVLLAGLFAGMIVLLFFMIARTANLASMELTRLGDAMAGVASSGNLKNHLQEEGVAEVVAVGHQFNAMVSRLSETTTDRDYINGVVNSLTSVLLVVGRNGVVNLVNSAATKFGEIHVGMEGQKAFELFSGIDSKTGDHVNPGTLDPWASNQYEDLEIVYPAKNGGDESIFIWACYLLEENSEAGDFVFIGLDMSQQRHAEAQLNIRDRGIEAAKIGVTLVDCRAKDMPVSYVNQGFINITGYSAPEVLGKNCRFLQGAETDKNVVAELRKAIKTGASLTVTLRNYRKNGDAFWNELSLTPIRDSIGQLTHYMGVQQDITELLENTARLKDSEEHLTTVLGGILDGVISIDEQGQIISFNPAAEKLFGYAQSDVVGRNVKMLMPDPYQSEHDGYLRNYRETGEKKIIGIGREVTCQRADGTVFPAELGISEMVVQGERMFVGVIRDITERKISDRMKSEFVSTVSHELRTPLTSIKGALAIVNSGAIKDPDRMTRMLELAINNTDRLISLVNDLLDFEKLQAGSMDFHFEELDPEALIQKAQELLQPYAQSSDVRLEMLAHPPFAPVLGDEQRLLQVLSNLVSNAVKFSNKEDVVTLSVEPADTGLRFSVRDNGVGIPEDFREKLFDRFTQADASDTRAKGGTGLGLSISKSIVEKHGGEIGYTSILGSGSTFYFDLPTTQASADTHTDVSKQEGSIPLNAGQTLSHDGSLPRILHVEDDRDLCEMLSEAFDGVMNYVFTRSLGEARKALHGDKFDLVIIDPGLGDGDGLQLLTEFQGTLQAGVPVIVFSSDELPSSRRENIDLALVKSKHSSEQLIEGVKSLLKKYGSSHGAPV
jgi:PAS domain S-box-containing protein